MNSNPFLTGIMAVLLLLPIYELQSQHIGPPPVSSLEMQSDLDRVYGADQRLISGNFYHGVPSGYIDGHPYSINEEWKTGKVILGNRTYNNLLMKYDISSNNLVLNTRNLNNSAIILCLNTEKISKFTLGEKRYIRHSGNEKENKIQFYEVITEGKITYLILRSKELIIISGGVSDYIYKEHLSNFLLVNDELIVFKRKRSLFKLFPEHKSSLKKFIRKEQIHTGKKNTKDRARLVSYYNSLLSDSE